MYTYTFVLGNGIVESINASSVKEAVAALVEYTNGEISFQLLSVREVEEKKDNKED